MVEVLDSRITDTLAIATVRDQIIAILVAELANQVTLAQAASADTDPYLINITREKTIPWNKVSMPLCNVSYDTGSILANSSPASSDQQGDNFYNLDIYVEKPGLEDSGDVTEGDERAAVEAIERASTIYFIIMANINTKLQLAKTAESKGIVGHRIIREILPFQPTFGDNPTDHIFAIRLRLEVRQLETVPKIVGDPLEGLDLIVKRSDTTLVKDIDIDIEIT